MPIILLSVQYSTVHIITQSATAHYWQLAAASHKSEWESLAAEDVNTRAADSESERVNSGPLAKGECVHCSLFSARCHCRNGRLRADRASRVVGRPIFAHSQKSSASHCLCRHRDHNAKTSWLTHEQCVLRITNWLLSSGHSLVHPTLCTLFWNAVTLNQFATQAK